MTPSKPKTDREISPLAFIVVIVAVLFFFAVNSGYDFDPTRNDTKKLIGEVQRTNFLISLYMTVQLIRWGFKKVDSE